jgi:hypothetical protein
MIEYIEVDGKTMEFLDYKNDKIKGELEDILQDFLKEQLLDKTGRKKFGFRILCQIEDCLGKYGRMSADEFVNLTADDIDDLWWHFHSLMAYYNRFFEIVPNLQSFMLYARINLRQYKQLKESQDEDIRSAIAFIEDRLIGKGFSAGESGNANDKAVMNRLKSADVGHNVVSASEERVINAVVGKTPQELQRELDTITKGFVGGGDIKRLG